MRPAPVALAMLVFLTYSAQAKTLVHRDPQGRKTGTTETQADGSAVYRDPLGRRTGTVERSGDHIIKRDALGRKTETIDRR